MSVLADFLEAQRDAIVARFSEGVQAMATPAGDALVAGVPALLLGLVRALRAGGPDETAVAAGDESGERGPEFDLGAVVRAYDLLRACVFERLAATGVTPSLGELGMLSERLCSATAEAVQRQTAARQEGSDAERLHLLGLFQ